MYKDIMNIDFMELRKYKLYNVNIKMHEIIEKALELYGDCKMDIK